MEPNFISAQFTVDVFLLYGFCFQFKLIAAGIWAMIFLRMRILNLIKNIIQISIYFVIQFFVDMCAHLKKIILSCLHKHL